VTHQYVEFSTPYSGCHRSSAPTGSTSRNSASAVRVAHHGPVRFGRPARDHQPWAGRRRAICPAGRHRSVAFWYQREPHAPFPALPDGLPRRQLTAAVRGRNQGPIGSSSATRSIEEERPRVPRLQVLGPSRPCRRRGVVVQPADGGHRGAIDPELAGTIVRARGRGALPIELDRVRSVRDVDEGRAHLGAAVQDGLRLHGVLTLATAQDIVMTRVLVPWNAANRFNRRVAVPARQEAFGSNRNRAR